MQKFSSDFIKDFWFLPEGEICHDSFQTNLLLMVSHDAVQQNFESVESSNRTLYAKKKSSWPGIEPGVPKQNVNRIYLNNSWWFSSWSSRLLLTWSYAEVKGLWKPIKEINVSWWSKYKPPKKYVLNLARGLSVQIRIFLSIMCGMVCLFVIYYMSKGLSLQDITDKLEYPKRFKKVIIPSLFSETIFLV